MLKLTTAHLIIAATVDALFLRLLTPTGISDSLATSLRATTLLLRLTSAAGALVDAGAATLGHAQQLADFQEVGLDSVDEALGLAVLAGRADGDAAVFDDVADTEALAGRGAETEVTQGRVAAVGGAEDGVVDFVPAGVGEYGGEGDGRARAAVARGCGGDFQAVVFVAEDGAAFGRCGGVGLGCGWREGTVRAAVDTAEVCVGFGIDGALPEAHERVEVAILSLGFGAILRGGGVLLAGFAQELNLLCRRILTPERSDETGTFMRNCTNSLGTAVVEGLGHRRLIHRFHATVKAIISSLESHLNESVRREAH